MNYVFWFLGIANTDLRVMPSNGLSSVFLLSTQLHTELHDLRSKVTKLEDQVQYFALMYQLASSEPSP